VLVGDQPPAGGDLISPRSGSSVYSTPIRRGFLRDGRSLVQIIGRAARNVNAKVVLYADARTDSIRKALTETERRRNMQLGV